MSNSKIREIQDILSEVDALLRERLQEAGIDIGHVLLAITSDGDGIVRSNIGPAEPGDMAELLTDITSGANLQQPEDEPSN